MKIMGARGKRGCKIQRKREGTQRKNVVGQCAGEVILGVLISERRKRWAQNNQCCSRVADGDSFGETASEGCLRIGYWSSVSRMS